MTTLKPGSKYGQAKFCKLTFLGKPSMEIVNVLKHHHKKCVYSNNSKMKELIGNSKNKLPRLNKAGIYSIQCADYPLKYIG